MASVYPTNQIDGNLLPSNINSYIAKGPDYSWIGNLPDSYFSGQQAGYAQRNRDLFAQGLPKDDNGNVDWGQVQQQLLQAQGSGGVGNAVALRALDIQQKLLDQPMPDPYGASSQPSTPSQGSGNVATPPAGTTDMGTQPGSTNGAVAPPRGTPGAGTTLRQIGQQYNKDPQQLSQLTGIGVDDQVDLQDPQTRQAIMGALRGQGINGSSSGPGLPPNTGAVGNSQPQNPQFPPSQAPGARPQPSAAPGGPSAPVAQPVQNRPVLQNQPVPQPPAQTPNAQPAPQPQIGANPQPNIPGPSPQEVRLRQAAAAMTQRAQALGLSQQTRGAAQAASAQAQAYNRAADQLQEARINGAQLTPEQKNVASGAGEQGAARNALAEGDAKDYQKDYQGVSLAARAAQNQIDEARLGKSMTMQPGFYSGAFGEFSKTYNQLKAALGPQYAAAQPQEVFDKVVNNMLIQQVRALGQSGVGRVLQTEVNTMRQGIASLGITPISNRALFELSARVSQQTRDVAGIASQVNQAVSRGQIPPGQYSQALNDAVQKYYDDHPLVTDQEKQDPKILGAPDVPAPYPKWNANQQQNWARSVGLQAGDPVRGPDGKVYQAR